MKIVFFTTWYDLIVVFIKIDFEFEWCLEVSDSDVINSFEQMGFFFFFQDQVLSSMQQKLDNLCEEMSNIRSQPGNKNVEVEPPPSRDAFGCDKIKFIDCGCWHCDQHQDLLSGLMVRFIFICVQQRVKFVFEFLFNYFFS